MRVAITLPALPATSLQRRALLAVLSGLSDRGLRPEAFTEEPRSYAECGVEVYHYLRAPERHTAEPFDGALYPLGRDWRPYEASWYLMRRFPGIVWVLDPVLHHLIVAGAALQGLWDEYRTTLERAFGSGDASSIATCVASGWAVRSTYRRYDPVPAVLAGQSGICAATPTIAKALAHGDLAADVVPLPTPRVGEATDRRPRRRCRRVLFLTFHYGWPDPVLRVMRATLDRDPDVDLRVVVPDLVRQVSVGPRADALGIGEQITWLDTDSALEGEAMEADLLVYLRDDPTVEERALVDVAMQQGTPVLALRAEGNRELLDIDGVVSVEPGRALEPALIEWISVMLEDVELYRGLSSAARARAARPSNAPDTARELAAVLARRSTGILTREDPTAATWARLRAAVRAAVYPNGAAEAVTSVLDDLFENSIPAAHRQTVSR